MEPLNLVFKISSIIGFWMPSNLSTKSDKNLYNVYRILTFPSPFLLATGLLFRMILEDLKFEELTETLFVFLSMTIICCKSLNFLLRRDDIINLSKMLSSDYARPQNSAERAIQDEYNKFIRFRISNQYTII